MEVHPHSHKGHDKKSWKNYVSEFLMLFLAVFAGFIAENLRENYVDKEKAQQYITSMINDLQKDTMQIQQVIHANRKKIKDLDSLLFYLKETVSDSMVKNVYRNSNNVGGSILFESETGTITQLKNAGGLRLIKDTAAVNRITEYDQINELSKKQGGAYYQSTMEILNMWKTSWIFLFRRKKPQTLLST